MHRGRHRARRIVGFAEYGEDFELARSSRRSPIEQAHAERDEVVREAHAAHCPNERQLVWRNGILAPLADEDLERPTAKRLRAGQRFVQHDAHAVPVGRRPELFPRRVLWGHVGRGTEHRGREVVVVERASSISHEAEIEDDQPAVVPNEHVRWLEVAMNFSGVVERSETAGELRERVPEPGDVENATRDGHRRVRLRKPLYRSRLGKPHAGDERGEVVWAQSAAHVAHEVDPIHELHREEGVAVRRRNELVKLDEVRVNDVRKRAKFAFELLHLRRAGADQGLQRHVSATLAIERFVHYAHSPGAETRAYLEPARQRAGQIRQHRRRLSARQGRRQGAHPRRSFECQIAMAARGFWFARSFVRGRRDQPSSVIQRLALPVGSFAERSASFAS